MIFQAFTRLLARWARNRIDPAHVRRHTRLGDPRRLYAVHVNGQIIATSPDRRFLETLAHAYNQEAA